MDIGEIRECKYRNRDDLLNSFKLNNQTNYYRNFNNSNEKVKPSVIISTKKYK